MPPDFYIADAYDEDSRDPDVRVSQQDEDRHVQKENEFYEDDGDNDRMRAGGESEDDSDDADKSGGAGRHAPLEWGISSAALDVTAEDVEAGDRDVDVDMS